MVPCIDILNISIFRMQGKLPYRMYWFLGSIHLSSRELCQCKRLVPMQRRQVLHLRISRLRRPHPMRGWFRYESHSNNYIKSTSRYIYLTHFLNLIQMKMELSVAPALQSRVFLQERGNMRLRGRCYIRNHRVKKDLVLMQLSCACTRLQSDQFVPSHVMVFLNCVRTTSTNSVKVHDWSLLLE